MGLHCCCSASCVFYDSLLSSVTSPKNYDKVSALGYSLGYLGGALMLVVNAMMYQKPELFGLSSGAEGVKYSFLSVSIWWFVFTMPIMFFVPEPDLNPNHDSVFKLFYKSIREINHTVIDLIQNKNVLYFMIAFWFYIDGVSTFMSMAIDFGISLGFEAGDLIKALLLTQFVGFPAAYLSGVFAQKWGSKFVITFCLMIYILVCIGASMMTESWQFYVMAAMIGISQGGVQALSRSMFAFITPAEKSGEYFGFFNLLGKFASILGPLLMAGAARLFGHPQKTVLSLLVLFILGLYFLSKVKMPAKQN